jgi:hypothetical protein
MLDVNDVLRQALPHKTTGFIEDLTDEQRQELFKQLTRMNALRDKWVSNAASMELAHNATHNATPTLRKRATLATGTAPEAVEEETDEETEEETAKLQPDGLYEFWQPCVVRTTVWTNPDDK